MTTNKCVHDLPDEILIKIFSYLSLEDIVLGVRHVNNRWFQVAEDSKIWSSLCYRPSIRTPESDIISIIKQSPKLHTFIPDGCVPKHVLEALISNCKDIRKLELYIDNLHYNLIQKLVKECNNIEDLSIVEIDFDSKKCLKLIAKCTKLKVLRLTSTVAEGRRNVFEDIANGCPSLQNLDLRNLYDYSNNDLLLLLQKKKDILTSLSLRWSSEKGTCTLPVVEICTNLENLHVEEYSDIKTAEGFSSLKKITNLKTLSMPYFRNCNVNYFVEYFKTGPVYNLVKLDLSVYEYFENKLAVVIFQTCPKLKHLILIYCPKLTDEGLQTICLLADLEKLCLAGCDNLTDVGMSYIVKCKNILYLNLNSCGKLTNESLELCCSNLKLLQELHLNGFPAKPQTALTIPKSFKYLKVLDISAEQLENTVINELKTSMSNVRINLLQNSEL